MDLTYGDFLGMEVVRDDEGVASVIADYHKEKPVRLIGFFRDADKSDLEIREEAWEYYQELFGLIKLM